jgi:hypothetical protein
MFAQIKLEYNLTYQLLYKQKRYIMLYLVAASLLYTF